MNIIFVLTLALCSFDLTAARSRENDNVLVPNNDVNMHAKIKKLLIDEVDPKDFSDNEVESLNSFKNPKFDKLRNRKYESENAVFDDKNKNIEDNQIDRDVSILRAFENSASEEDLIDISGAMSESSENFISTKRITNETKSKNSSTTHSSSSNALNSTNWNSTESINSTWFSSADSSTSTSVFVTSKPETTTNRPDYDEIQENECLRGKSDGIRLWMQEDGGHLNTTYIDNEYSGVKYLDLSGQISDHDFYTPDIINNTELVFYSLAYNNFLRLPHKFLTNLSKTLKYLSLTGNYFLFLNVTTELDDPENLEFSFEKMEIEELDMRHCKLRIIHSHFVKKLAKLEYLYLSHNQITEIHEKPFPPKLRHLNLSFNKGIEITDSLNVDQEVFKELKKLETLDFSFTRLDARSVVPLPANLMELSLCYTQLPSMVTTFFDTAEHIRYLDISGNPALILNETMFQSLSNSLEVLYVRKSNVRNLDWTSPLKNLKLFDLLDNNIHTVKNDSFSHMTNLLKLNLEKNSIGNWYDRLFDQNQQLEILNLRDNKLTLLTNDMKADLLSVKYLAIGNNDFECTCALQQFMEKLFSATEQADVDSLRYNRVTVDDSNSHKKTTMSTVTKTTRASLGNRNYVTSNYDVILRTYEKYYEMVDQSIQALRAHALRNSGISKGLVTKSKAKENQNDFETILFDYQEKNYQCMNATEKKQTPIINVTDLCEYDEDVDATSPYGNRKRNSMMILSVSIPSVIVASVILCLIYWKWWYVKYFFVLCKNSAILTFMDDSDGGKDSIIKGQSNLPVETYLYDVFVSYSDQNREWVLEEFIPNVERRESIKVCLHERDFQVGYGILENIVSCMDRSRCLLLLVSENFLLSQWCQFEMNLAQHRLLETRREKLILVLLEDIPARKQPKTLKYLMRTKTYIKWPQNGTSDEKQLFWKRLKKSIISSKWETETYGSIA